jgi:hypothetical protein
MSKAIPVNMKINVKDFERIGKRIAQVKAEVEADTQMTAEEKAAKFESVLGHYTGPDTGLVWDDSTGKISIAPGYHADADGNVVKD